MRNFTWNGANAAWNTANWGFLASDHPYYPGDTGSTTDDTVTLAGASAPNSMPAVNVVVASLVTTNLATHIAIGNIEIKAGGTLLIGKTGTSYAHWFGGKFNGSGTWEMRGAASMDSARGTTPPGMKIYDQAVFGDCGINIGGDIDLYDSARFTSGGYTLVANAVFTYHNTSSYDNGGSGVVQNGFSLTHNFNDSSCTNVVGTSTPGFGDQVDIINWNSLGRFTCPYLNHTFNILNKHLVLCGTTHSILKIVIPRREFTLLLASPGGPVLTDAEYARIDLTRTYGYPGQDT